MINFFSLLDLPMTFAVDEQTIQQHYLRLQRHHHPDRLVGATAVAKLAAQQHAADLNEAYQTLRDPVKRGYHLLMVLGEDVPAHTTTDTALLLESLEHREALATATTVEAVQALKAQNAALQQQVKTAINDAFTACDLQQAAFHVLRLHYLRTVAADMHRKQEHLADAIADR